MDKEKLLVPHHQLEFSVDEKELEKIQTQTQVQSKKKELEKEIKQLDTETAKS